MAITISNDKIDSSRSGNIFYCFDSYGDSEFPCDYDLGLST